MGLHAIDHHRLRALAGNPRVLQRLPFFAGKLGSMAGVLELRRRPIETPSVCRVVEHLEDLLEREASGKATIQPEYHRAIDSLYMLWMAMAIRIATRKK